MPLDRTWYNTLVDDSGSGTDGTIWDKAAVDSLMDDIDAALAPLEAAGTLEPHAETHAADGTDPVSIATMQVLGLDELLDAKVADDDARLTDARTPTAHAASHQNGGSDPLSVTTLAGFPGGTTGFLRADGSFAIPPSGGGGGSVNGPLSSTVGHLATWN